MTVTGFAMVSRMGEASSRALTSSWRCSGVCAVDLDIDGDLRGPVSDGFVDAEEAAEICCEGQRQADFIEGDVPGNGEECKGAV